MPDDAEGSQSSTTDWVSGAHAVVEDDAKATATEGGKGCTVAEGIVEQRGHAMQFTLPCD